MRIYSIIARLECWLMIQERIARDAFYASKSRFTRTVWYASMHAERTVSAIESAVYMSMSTTS